MGKKSKRIKIPKDRDIEEFVRQCEENEKIETMEQVMEKLDGERQEFKENLKVSIEEQENNNEKIERKVRNYSKRRDAQIADEKRRETYLKAMNKVEER